VRNPIELVVLLIGMTLSFRYSVMPSIFCGC
jgi:hypothetical protein